MNAVRVPITAERAMSAWLSEIELIRRAMSGTTTLEVLDRAEAALDRMASKAEIRMVLRSAKAACRANRRPPATLPAVASPDPLAIPLIIAAQRHGR